MKNITSRKAFHFMNSKHQDVFYLHEKLSGRWLFFILIMIAASLVFAVEPAISEDFVYHFNNGYRIYNPNTLVHPSFAGTLEYVTCTDNLDCGENEYCLKAPGDCNGVGSCQPLSEWCAAVWDPVCGCDGETYSNSCYAAMFGVNVASLGVCNGCTDNDGDGFSLEGGMCGPVDCDDGDYFVNPAAQETCNGIDDNCSGSTDEEYANRSPVADAGGPYTVTEGDSLLLDASGSFDPDSGCGDSIVSYAWDLDLDGQYDDAAGSSPIIPWSSLVSLGRSDPGSYQISLQVWDTIGATGVDETSLVIINNCSDNLECGENEYCLKAPGDCYGVGSCQPLSEWCASVWDPVCGCDGETYSNSCYAAMFGVNVASLGVCNGCTDNDGDGFSLEGGMCGPVDCDDGDYFVNPAAQETCNGIDDNCNDSTDEDYVNRSPVADAGGPYTITEGDSLPLDAQGSFDPDSGCGDSIVSYAWDLDLDGQYDDAAGSSPIIPWSSLVSLGRSDPGSYQISLQVWDTIGATGVDETSLVIINNCSDNLECGENEYCLKAPGDCYGVGTCQPLAELCPTVLDPVCGCDGETYSNSCFAAQVGVNVASSRPCWCIDYDGDGFFSGGELCGPVDCDDADSLINPGAQEICNGVDDDCDGSTDEGLGQTTCGLGECEHTIDNCMDGVPQICDPFEGMTIEICDGFDNDCDGSTDEDLGQTTCGLGECEHTIDSCIGGVPQICDPFEGATIEICDGFDNDCDGSTDEDLGQTTCGLGECDHSIDSCIDGMTQICDPFEGATIEICDGLDNDCDGSIDEEYANGSPVADAGGPYVIAEGDSLTLEATGSTDPDSACGDYIQTYEWDLNDDGSFGDVNGEVMNLTWAEIEALVCDGACDSSLPYPIGLMAVDSNGGTGYSTAQIEVIPVPIFYDDFSDCNETNLEWDRITGRWRCRRGALISGGVTNNLIVANPEELRDFDSGSIKARIKLTYGGLNAPNASLIFGYRDNSFTRYYRYVKIKKKRLLIGQAGNYEGVWQGRKAAVPREFEIGRWYDVSLELYPDGLVEVYIDDEFEPALSYRFDSPAAGRVGFHTFKYRVKFDDYEVWDE